MNILMMTNTFTPHVGGVARSVASFADQYRRLGCRTVVVAPAFEGMPEVEEDVVRVPTIRKFHGSDFSVGLPLPGLLTSTLRSFKPDIVHTHHPFLLGDTALRTAHARRIPLVFTAHTLYDQYTHYLPGDSPAMKKFIIQLWTGYARLCDQVLAPSESVARLLQTRGVDAPLQVIPTGVDLEAFQRGDGPAARRRLGLPEGAFVVGHVGRLAREKNLPFLARAVAIFMESHPGALFLVVGRGAAENELRESFARRGLERRLRLAGTLEDRALADAYHAMDAFAFASRTETQGLVLSEAMAAGVPVLALDASGSHELIEDGVNGRLLPVEDDRAFAEALGWLAALDSGRRRELTARALRTVSQISISRCARKTLKAYARLLSKGPVRPKDKPWSKAGRLLMAEWELMANLVAAAAAAAK